MGVQGCGCPACNPLISSRPRVEEIPCTLTHKERNLKRMREQYREAQETIEYCKENRWRYEAHRNKVLAERKAASAIVASEVEHFEGETIEVNSPTIEEMLADPTLDSITPVNIDPVSMAVDDIGALIQGGGEFIKDPSLAGVAAMAITAIPGKVADDVGGKLLKEAMDRNPTKKLRGRKIQNSDMAGKAVQTKGGEVWFDFDGFPDFTPYSKKTVRIDGLTGVMSHDIPLAMKKSGLTEYDKKNYVWHHHQDGTSMMLVPRNVHSHLQGGVSHSGGRAVNEHNLMNLENKIKYPSPDEIL